MVASAAGLVNALSTRAATNLVLLVGLWAILVVAAPALLRLAVAATHPASSRASLVLAMREASTAEVTRARQLLARSYEDHPELAPGDRRSVTPEYVLPFYAAMQRVDDRLRPMLASFEAQVARQQAMVTRWQFVSPALVAREAFDAVACTGIDRHRAFMAQVDGYHAEYQRFFRDRVGAISATLAAATAYTLGRTRVVA